VIRRILVAVVIVAVVAVAFVALTAGAAKPTIPVVGDSITVLAGHDISVALTGEYHVDVQAKSGQRIDQMLSTLQRVLARHPRAAVVNLGTNDALQAQTHPHWQSGFDRMIAFLVPVRCVELTTINTRLPGSPVRSVIASEINRAITQAVAGDPNFHVVDWNAVLHASTAARLLRPDDVHPTPAGQLTLAHLARVALDRDCR
jgi:lysophospholipase L1-like esterase